MAGLPRSSSGIYRTEAMRSTIRGSPLLQLRCEASTLNGEKVAQVSQHKCGTQPSGLPTSLLPQSPAPECEQHDAAVREQRWPHPAATPHNSASSLHLPARKKTLPQLPRLNSIFVWQLRMQASSLATLNHFKETSQVWYLTPSSKSKIVEKGLLYSSA